MNKKRVLFFVVTALALALFEIQIEGGTGGWASEMTHCWRAAPDSMIQALYGAFMNGKPCDGFHLTELLFLVLMFHLPFVYGLKWTASAEMEILANFFLFAVCWDFLWFIFNPAFGWSNFNAQHIWWHKFWFGPLPRDYYGGFATASVLAALSGYLAGKEKFKAEFLRIAKDSLGILGLTTALSIVAELVRLAY